MSKKIIGGGVGWLLLLGAAAFLAHAAQPTVISGIVLPHHDLVKAQREQLLATVAHQIKAPDTLIVVSPNHYEAGRGVMQTTSQMWPVAGGAFSPNTAVIQALLHDGVSEEPTSFPDEHGIHLIIGDLFSVWPKARIVPIILKREATPAQITQLANTLAQTCSRCLMISSVDFSHYQPALLAAQHDELSIRALENLDQAALLKNAEVDSPAALALLAQWAQLHNTAHFSLFNHTNSGQLLGDGDSPTTTHVFGWYQSGPRVTPEPNVTFLIGGDMMFGRDIAHHFGAGNLTASMAQLGERLLWGSDADIVNLEGPVSEVPVPDVPHDESMVFHFPPQAVHVLQFLHINVASLANNHSANAGLSGVETTRRLLTAANIQPLGGPGTQDVTRIVTITGQKLKLAIIGVHALLSVPDITSQIRELKKDPTTRVLVFPHWGVEYAPVHTAGQQQLAHRWIDAGADIVIGSHPHVVEDAEVYKNKPIFYSLGNLLFDQTFSPGVQQGLLVAGSFDDKGLTLFALPTQSTNYVPRLMTGAAKQSRLAALYQPLADFRKQTPVGDVFFFPN